MPKPSKKYTAKEVCAYLTEKLFEISRQTGKKKEEITALELLDEVFVITPKEQE